MNQTDRSLLQNLQTELAQIQQRIETLLAQKTAWKKTLDKRSEEYAVADALCDSLGYAVDDLDSVLGNLEELTTE